MSAEQVERDDWRLRAPAMLRDLEGPHGEPLATHFDRRWLWRLQTFLVVNGTTHAHRQMAWDLKNYLNVTCEHEWGDPFDYFDRGEFMWQCLWCSNVRTEDPS